MVAAYNRSQVQQFINLTTRLAIIANGALVLITHPSLTGINTGSGLSGSTQWHNAVRARFFRKSPEAEPGEQPDTDLREIEFKKNQYGERWRKTSRYTGQTACFCKSTK